jgi:hypothetical protein
MACAAVALVGAEAVTAAVLVAALLLLECACVQGLGPGVALGWPCIATHPVDC